MVLSGQFLERATIIASAGSYLEGLWQRGASRPALLICPPHPRRGSSMDSPVCAELAFAASWQGHATLRFNYRGAGASEGTLNDELSACVEDASSALDVLAENVGHGAPVVAGYRFGACVAVALAARRPEIAGVALVAPDAGECDVAGLTTLSVPRFIAAGTERSSLDALARLCERAGSELVLIEGADRVFSSGLPYLGREVVRFLKACRSA